MKFWGNLVINLSDKNKGFGVITDNHLLNVKSFIERNWRAYENKMIDDMINLFNSCDNDIISDGLDSSLENYQEGKADLYLDEQLKQYFLDYFSVYEEICQEIKNRNLIKN